jgi:hypothetical protein
MRIGIIFHIMHQFEVLHHFLFLASIPEMMHNTPMRTTVNLAPETHEFVSYYASARGISLSTAINELIRKAEKPPNTEPLIVFSPDGFPMFPPTAGRITSEMVKKLEEEEYDPKKFT